MASSPVFRSKAQLALQASCVVSMMSISIVAAQTAAKSIGSPTKTSSSPASKGSDVSAAKALTIPALHAAQQHHNLGKGDMYWSGASVKWIFNDGDFICLFRGSDRKVFLVLPSKKAVFEQTFSEFQKRGITFTQGGQEACSVLKLKQSSKQSEFQKFPVKTYTILAPARSTGGEVRMINIGLITAMTQPPKTRDVADFITLAYGLPKVDTVVLDMRVNFRVGDGSLWFKTSERDLPTNEHAGQCWLRTIKLENVKVASDFFDAPKNFKKVASQEQILGMSPSTRDFEDLMFAEPNQKK